jgi:hypothetical protein
MFEMITYSNPRLEAVIENWPIGGKRTTATFRIEAKPGKGERATRFTLDPKTGKPSATKVLTYATKARIVDGSDGRTYIIEQSMYDFISVMRSDMKFTEETIWPRDPRFADITALFKETV